MYIEIDKLETNELEILKNMFKGRIREFDSVYTEVCRLEVESTIDSLGYDIESMTEKDINDIAEQIDFSSDYIFQDLCELTAEKVHDFFSEQKAN